ncbi:MAG TPA: hypothetical protein VL181_08845 [Holophagaceae bacterium]|nr:hypothetical protein [Holophagaceae bacterium]
MPRAAALFPAALVLLTACQRPEVEAFRQHPRPVAVVCAVAPDGPGSKDFAATLEAALRVRLATRVMVVPEGVAPPPEAVRLEVKLERRGLVNGSSSTGAAVGVGVGTTVGVLSAAAGDRDWFFDGLFWGLFAGSNAAAEQDRFAWLGYYPDRISSEARLMEAGDSEPLASESIDTEDLMPMLEPLRGDEGSDEVRVQEVEAQAYARLLVGRLAERFQWPRGPARYYGAPAQAPEPQAPAAQPLDQPDPPVPEQPAPDPSKDAPDPPK